jgi:hypothetical protein
MLAVRLYPRVTAELLLLNAAPGRYHMRIANSRRNPSEPRSDLALGVKRIVEHEDLFRAGLRCHNLWWDGTGFLSWTTSIGGRRRGGAITELHPGAIGGTLALLICGILMLVDRRRAR